MFKEDQPTICTKTKLIHVTVSPQPDSLSHYCKKFIPAVYLTFANSSYICLQINNKALQNMSAENNWYVPS